MKNINFEDEIKTELEGDALHYTGIFSEDIFRNVQIDSVLEQLQIYHIILNYKKIVVEDEISVDFEYVNPEI